MDFITDFGDGAVTGALAAILAACLLFSGKNKKAAFAVVFAYALSAFIVTAGKVILYSQCGAGVSPFGLKSPSGHAALSVTVYGIAALVFSSALRQSRYRFLPCLFAAGLAGMIAVSRLALGVHTGADVLAGAGIGFFSCFVTWRLMLRNEKIICNWTLFGAFFIAGIILFHGLHFPAEDFIQWFSFYIKSHIRSC